MEFWGLEVKPGETVKVDPGEDRYLHLSQASLGEIKKDKGNEVVPIFVKCDDKKLMLGRLSSDKCAQIPYDLVFEKEFELSHGSKSANIYFFGYKSVVEGDEYDDTESETDGEDQKSAQDIRAFDKSEIKDEKSKPAVAMPNSLNAEVSVVKPKPKKEDLQKVNKQNAAAADDNDDDDDESEEESDDEGMLEDEDDSDQEDDDESSDDEDEATPEKAEPGNKRRAGFAHKTPVPEKKARLVSPVANQKKDGKKGGHVATPHPAKLGKTPANADKSRQQTPKSPGSVSCKSCSKTFNSDNALQAHTKAKHSAGK